MTDEKTSDKHEWTMDEIFLLAFGIAMALLVLVIGIELSTESYHVTHNTQVDCYDRFGNRIIGIKCEGDKIIKCSGIISKYVFSYTECWESK